MSQNREYSRRKTGITSIVENQADNIKVDPDKKMSPTFLGVRIPIPIQEVNKER